MMGDVSGAFACKTARRRRVEVRGLELHLLEWGSAARPASCCSTGEPPTPTGSTPSPPLPAERPSRRRPRPARPRGERVGSPARVRDRGLRGRHRRRPRPPWVELGGPRRTLDGRPQRDRLRGVASRSGPGSGHRRLTPGDPSRAARPDEGARGPARPPASDDRGGRGRFPAPAARDERGSRPARPPGARERRVAGRCRQPRFDPACYAARVPVDGWPLLPRITAPTLVVRGERSPILPRLMAERLCAELPDARLVEIEDAYHHLVLDRPEAVRPRAPRLPGWPRWLRAWAAGAAASGRPVAS